MLTRARKIEALVALGDYLRTHDERLGAHAHRASVHNPWFTRENIRFALDTIAEDFLTEEALNGWLARYPDRTDPMHTVGLIAAGNVPLVGFHDILSVLASGNVAQVKLSDRDPYLIPFVMKWLSELEPRFADYFSVVEKLSGFDAVIATGSNNSARYFKQYFGKYPHIIRMNRNAVAVLDGNETNEQLEGLCRDIFTYFGLGCRSVSHIRIPAGYDFGPLREAVSAHGNLGQHSKYQNNLDYHSAIWILNKDPHVALPNLLLAERPHWISPVGCLFYSFYEDLAMVEQEMHDQLDEIQCVVSDIRFRELKTVPLGRSQRPAIDDYADGVNTLDFLYNLNI